MAAWGACLALSLAAWLAQPGDACVAAWLGQGWLSLLDEPLHYADGAPVLFADPPTQGLAERCRAAWRSPAGWEALSAGTLRRLDCWLGPPLVTTGAEVFEDTE